MAHPDGELIGECGGFFLAVPGDELAKSGAQRRFSEMIDVDAVKQRFGEGFADITERRATGVCSRKFSEGLSNRREHADAHFMAKCGATRS